MILTHDGAIDFVLFSLYFNIEEVEHICPHHVLVYTQLNFCINGISLGCVTMSNN